MYDVLFLFPLALAVCHVPLASLTIRAFHVLGFFQNINQRHELVHRQRVIVDTIGNKKRPYFLFLVAALLLLAKRLFFKILPVLQVFLFSYILSQSV